MHQPAGPAEYRQAANHRVTPPWIQIEKLFSWFLSVSFSLLIISFFFSSFSIIVFSPTLSLSLTRLYSHLALPAEVNTHPSAVAPGHRNLMNSNAPHWQNPPPDIWKVCLKLKFISVSWLERKEATSCECLFHSISIKIRNFYLKNQS